MLYFLFFTALAVTAGGCYNWYRERGNPESARVYRTIALIAAIAVLSSGLHLVPDSFWNENGYWAVPAADGVLCAGIACGAVYLVRKRKSVSKPLFAACFLAFSAALAVCGTSLVRGIASFPSAEENAEKAKTAQAYAENVLVRQLGISSGDITTRANSYVSTEKHPVYLVGFAYRKGAGGPEKVYGFHLVTDDSGRCTILEQGEKTGNEIIGTDLDAGK